MEGGGGVSGAGGWDDGGGISTLSDLVTARVCFCLLLFLGLLEDLSELVALLDCSAVVTVFLPFTPFRVHRDQARVKLLESFHVFVGIFVQFGWLFSSFHVNLTQGSFVQAELESLHYPAVFAW